MLWPATLIGAVSGLALASIPGALLGGLLGQVLDRKLKLQSLAELRSRLRGPVEQLDDEALLFYLLGRLAKSDGRVGEAHIRLAREEMQRLGLDERARQQAMQAFGRGKQGRLELQGPLQALRSRPERAEALLRTCWRMAWADARIGASERALILQWGQWLGWSSAALQALADSYRPRPAAAAPGGDYPAALRLLGVGEASPPEQITRAYRRLLSRHHPDKVSGAGGSPQQVRAATERTHELQQAYQLVRRYRGF